MSTTHTKPTTTPEEIEDDKKEETSTFGANTPIDFFYDLQKKMEHCSLLIIHHPEPEGQGKWRNKKETNLHNEHSITHGNNMATMHDTSTTNIKSIIIKVPTNDHQERSNTKVKGDKNDIIMTKDELKNDTATLIMVENNLEKTPQKLYKTIMLFQMWKMIKKEPQKNFCETIILSSRWKMI